MTREDSTHGAVQSSYEIDRLRAEQAASRIEESTAYERVREFTQTPQGKVAVPIALGGLALAKLGLSISALPAKLVGAVGAGYQAFQAGAQLHGAIKRMRAEQVVGTIEAPHEREARKNRTEAARVADLVTDPAQLPIFLEASRLGLKGAIPGEERLAELAPSDQALFKEAYGAAYGVAEDASRRLLWKRDIRAAYAQAVEACHEQLTTEFARPQVQAQSTVRAGTGRAGTGRAGTGPAGPEPAREPNPTREPRAKPNRARRALASAFPDSEPAPTKERCR